MNQVRLISLLSCLFISFTVHAQSVQPETLFDRNNPAIVGHSTQMTFEGTPAVLIEPPQSQPEPVVNKAALIPPPNLSNKILNIPIHTPFGHERSAAFLDYTTDFAISIQVLDDNTLRIQEQIQFITTKPDNYFSRTFSKQITDANGHALYPQIQMTTAFQDTIPITLTQTEDSDTLTVTYDKPLPVGVHRFTLSYLVKDAIRKDASVANVMTSLTGINWPQIIERFSVFVMLPKKSPIYQSDLLFGSNNARIPDTVQSFTDEAGNILYQLNRPLPAFADVRLNLLTDENALPKAQTSFGTIPSGILAAIIYCVIIIGYALLSILTARRKKWKKPLDLCRRLPCLLWRIKLGLPVTDTEMNRICMVRQETNRTTILSGILHTLFARHWTCGLTKMTLSLFAFIRFNMEYIAGLTLLGGSLYFMLSYYHIAMTNGLIAFIIGLNIFALIVIDHWGTRHELKQLRELIRSTLVMTSQGLNLPPKSIPTYYLIALHLGFEEEWGNKLVCNNPVYRRLAFLHKEEK